MARRPAYRWGQATSCTPCSWGSVCRTQSLVHLHVCVMSPSVLPVTSKKPHATSHCTKALDYFHRSRIVYFVKP